MTVSSALLNSLELLAVSDDYPTLKVLVRACHELGSRSDSTPSLTTAAQFVGNRKIDGIIVDMKMRGVCEFIHAVRKSNSNRSALIFACAGTPEEVEMAWAAGANFVAEKPVSQVAVVRLLSTAAPTLVEERKKYFRHKLVVPVSITYDGVEHRALTSNMSETGMSIRSFRVFEPGSPVGFVFELPSGPSVKGTGEVMWVDPEGRAGVKFNNVTSAGSPQFSEWLEHRCMVLG
jgi:CheY-like chemotaxis protein